MHAGNRSRPPRPTQRQSQIPTGHVQRAGPRSASRAVSRGRAAARPGPPPAADGEREAARGRDPAERQRRACRRRAPARRPACRPRRAHGQPEAHHRRASRARSAAHPACVNPTARSRPSPPSRSSTPWICTAATPAVPSSRPSVPSAWKPARNVFCTADRLAQPLDGRLDASPPHRPRPPASPPARSARPAAATARRRRRAAMRSPTARERSARSRVSPRSRSPAGCPARAGRRSRNSTGVAVVVGRA